MSQLTISGLRKELERLTPKKVRTDVFNLVRTLENELAQYNRSQLFIDSKDVNGKPIGFYSPNTEVITKGKKKAGDPFNLYDKGDFIPSIFSKLQQDSLFFGSTDPKLNEVLSNLLSKDIFGLTEENLNKVIEERLLPLIIDYYHSKIFKILQ